MRRRARAAVRPHGAFSGLGTACRGRRREHDGRARAVDRRQRRAGRGHRGRAAAADHHHACPIGPLGDGAGRRHLGRGRTGVATRALRPRRLRARGPTRHPRHARRRHHATRRRRALAGRPGERAPRVERPHAPGRSADGDGAGPGHRAAAARGRQPAARRALHGREQRRSQRRRFAARARRAAAGRGCRARRRHHGRGRHVLGGGRGRDLRCGGERSADGGRRRVCPGHDRTADPFPGDPSCTGSGGSRCRAGRPAPCGRRDPDRVGRRRRSRDCPGGGRGGRGGVGARGCRDRPAAAACAAGVERPGPGHAVGGPRAGAGGDRERARRGRTGGREGRRRSGGPRRHDRDGPVRPPLP